MKQIVEVTRLHKRTIFNKIEQLNKRAKKLGFPPVTIEEISKSTGQLTVYDKYTHKSEQVLVTTYILEITGEPVYLEGHTFLGAIEHRPEGNYLFGEVPHQYKDNKPYCDHCKTSRLRKKTYILKNEYGEWLQVGSTCLRDFFDTTDPTTYAQAWSGFWVLLQDLDGLSHERGEWEINAKYHERLANTASFFSWIVFTAEKHGWTSRSNQGYNHPATVDTAWELKGRAQERKKSGLDYEAPSEAQYNKGLEILAAVTDQILSTPKEARSNYFHNLFILLGGFNDNPSEHTFPLTKDGFVASVYGVWQKSEKDKAFTEKAKEEAKESEYIGEIKERIDLNVTITKVIELGESNYPPFGMMFLNIMKDEDGNVLTWMTGQGLEEGLAYAGKGTVKAHEVYDARNGVSVKQTKITRCRLKAIAACPECNYGQFAENFADKFGLGHHPATPNSEAEDLYIQKSKCEVHK